MAVKYHCPKCDKRYVEWGAKKLDFQCPDCEEEKLVQIGSGNSGAKPKAKAKAKKASLKRKKAKKVVVADPVLTPNKNELNGNDPQGMGNPLDSGEELAGEDAPPKPKTKKDKKEKK